MKTADPVLTTEFAISGDELVAHIELTGPSYVHLECAAVLIQKISENSGVPIPEVLKDLARIL